MSILSNIKTGFYDEELDVLEAAIRQRKAALARRRFNNILPGTKVRFIETIRPTYLAGMEATVVGKKVKKLVVRLERPVGRFYGDIKVGPNLVELVDEGIIEAPGIVKHVGGSE